MREMLAYKFRLYPNKEEKLEAERPKLKLVDSRPIQPFAHGLQVGWMKQEDRIG